MSSTRINKTEAKELAIQVLKDKTKALAKREDIFLTSIKDSIIKSLPKEILEFKKYFPEYLQTSSYVQIITKEKTATIWLKDYLPCGDPSNYHKAFYSEKEARTFLKEKEELQKKKQEISDLSEELQIAFLSLRTFKKIMEAFPETENYLLKEKTKYYLAPNYDKLRKKLQN